nr:hypothetical protein [Nanoarchaeum sp.]
MKYHELLLVAGLSFASLSYPPKLVSEARCEVLQNNLEQRLESAYHEVVDHYSVPEDDHVLVLLGDLQRLYLLDRDGSLEKEYGVSTSKNGFSNRYESNKTPHGIHRIADKYGTNARYGTIFDVRRRTKKVFKSESGKALVTSRVMMIEGAEQRNRNTYSRDIYIHGTNKESAVGRPASLGCIRMKNRDVIELYDIVREGTYVNIKN